MPQLPGREKALEVRTYLEPGGIAVRGDDKPALRGQTPEQGALFVVLIDPKAICGEDELIEQAEEVIRLFAPNLVLGISDELSSTGDIERVRTIGKIVDRYNAEVLKP